MEKTIKMVSLILGGGQGSRLYPLTKDRSKPAVPIAGKYRLIDIPISNCINSGVRRMYVVTQFNSASLNQHIKNTYYFDHFRGGFVDILAAEQTPDNPHWFQGTADAVRQSLRHIRTQDYDYILILSGDQLYQMDFLEMAKEHILKNADLSIATIPVDASDAPDFGIMKVDKKGMIESFTEKPKSDILHEWVSPVSKTEEKKGKIYLASMGIYIFNRETMNNLLDDNAEATDFGIGDETDGTSNTILIGERAFKYHNLTVGAGNALGFSSSVNTPGTSAGIKAAGTAVYGLAYNGINWSANNRIHQPRGYSSNHTGGAMFVLSDGSVHFISENIDYNQQLSPSATVINGAWIDSTFERLIGKSDGGVVGTF